MTLGEDPDFYVRHLFAGPDWRQIFTDLGFSPNPGGTAMVDVRHSAPRERTMMSFTTRYDDDGFATVELNGPADPVTEFSKALVDEACASGVFMTRHRNTVTLHCSNGEWTYRLTAYRREIYRGELVDPATAPHA